ncbi:hypothetical protein BKA62DRAFT_219714 [Auriculariales sp. MPI-PUGE-AT-0066]|nr:hypothetical protein BKA62DRAFT_219714 [Auriculariales sp. MPI-PUGE-AT-0066]
MIAFHRFQQLAPELQAEVSACLPTSDLLNLNVASREMHALTTAHVLRRIELDLVVYEPATAAWPYQVDNSMELHQAQRKVIDTVAKHPEYAGYVHDLSWHVFADAGGMPSDFFRSLNSVERVRLNVSRGELMLDHANFGTLFPRMSAMTFAGQVTSELTAMTLHSPARLHELVLDHVHSPEPDFLLQLLEQLVGNCPELERLALRKPGNARGHEPFDLVTEEATLRRFAALANSCRATLSHLELTLTPMSHSIIFFGCDNRSWHVRSWLLPATFDPALGAWPLLRHLKLGGIALEPSELSHIKQAAPRVDVSLEVDAAAPGEYAMPTELPSFLASKSCG